MYQKRMEAGQSIVLLAIIVAGMLAFVAAAVDGGTIFAQRRQEQIAADSAAMAAALAAIEHTDYITAARTQASLNGFTNNGTDPIVEVYRPPVDGEYAGDNAYVQVKITATSKPVFSQFAFKGKLANTVEAVVHVETGNSGPLFSGNAIVGLDPNGNSFKAGPSNAQHWYIEGGGIFANNNAVDYRTNVNFLDENCVTAVGTATGFNCTVSQNNPGLKYAFPEDIIPLLPPIPACTGTAYYDNRGDGKIHEEAGYEGEGSVWSGGLDDHPWAPGIYCITNAGGNIHGTVSGTGVTFYIADTDFTMRYNGGGCFAAQAPTSGPYAGVLMFSNVTTTPCTQNVSFRGNGSAGIVGTIFMPSACIDWRGNSVAHMDHVQIIGYDVSSNGSASMYISYNADEQYESVIPAEIELSK